MELKEFLTNIKRWLKLVAIVTVCSVLAAAFISCFMINTVYEATTTIMIRTPKTASKGGSKSSVDDPLNVSSIQAYCTLVQSDLNIEKTICDLKINTSINKLHTLIKVAIIPNTGFIEVTAGGGRPQLAQDIANTLVKNLQLEVKKIKLDNVVIVVDPARCPKESKSPNLYLNMLIAGIAGFTVGIALAFFLENMDDTVKSLNIFTKDCFIPLIGAVPTFKKHSSDNPILENSIIARKDESYKIIRTKVDYRCSIKSDKVILVTSPNACEGKTTTAVNLAVSLGQMGKKVLLIDGNMRNPDLHTVFNLEDDKGLTSLLSKGKSLYDIRATQEKNLDVIVCGQKSDNPTELLESQGLSRIIEFGRSNYDMVIIDGPSVIPFADAFIVARLVDAAILVVNYRKTTLCSMQAALESLCNTNFLGVVVNRMFFTSQY